MQAFTRMLEMAANHTASEARVRLLAAYMQEVPEADVAAALVLLLNQQGRIPRAAAWLQSLADTYLDTTQWVHATHTVRDTNEAIALMWPVAERAYETPSPSLADILAKLNEIKSTNPETKVLAQLMDLLTASERILLLKIISGRRQTTFTEGEMRQAIARRYNQPLHRVHALWPLRRQKIPELLEELASGQVHPLSPNELPFRSFSPRRSIERLEEVEISTGEMLMDWAWDGLRVHTVAAHGQWRMYCDDGEEISDRFPELSDFSEHHVHVEAILQVTPGTEMHLEKRLSSRGNVKKRALATPAQVRLFDILEEAGEDIRHLNALGRRRRLEQWFQRFGGGTPGLFCPPAIQVDDVASLLRYRLAVPPNALGLIVRNPTWPWQHGSLFWPRPRQEIVAPIMYAEYVPGGSAADGYSLTIGVAGEGGLVPVAKMTSVLSRSDQEKLSAHIRAHTVDKFGPVRQLAGGDDAIIVVVSYDGVEPAPRRKGGIALRAPRIERICWQSPGQTIAKLWDLQNSVEST